jgi:hypothetical protein
MISFPESWPKWFFMNLVFLGVSLSSGIGFSQSYLGLDQPQPMAQRHLTMPESFQQLRGEEAITTKPTILDRSVWNAQPTSGTVRNHVPTRITLHHEASGRPAVVGRPTPVVLKNLQNFSQQQRPWCDVPYHYFVDVDGAIYEGRNWRIQGDTNTAYDPSGHLLICALGNFEIQVPTFEQLQSIVHLAAWLADYHNVDPGTFTAHRDHVPTLCPGRHLYSYVVSGFLEGEIRQRILEAHRTSGERDLTRNSR